MFRRSIKKNTETIIVTILAAITGISCKGITTVGAVASSKESPFLIGDVNCDETVDARDASEVLAYYAKTSAGSAGDTVTINCFGDVDGNGIVDAVDASTILTAYATAAVEKRFTWPIASNSNLVNGSLAEHLNPGYVWAVKAEPDNESKTIFVLNEDEAFHFAIKRWNYDSHWKLIIFNDRKSMGYIYFDSDEELDEVVREQVAMPGWGWIG